ncbi:NAD(P)-binding protein [Paraburkholderia sp. A1RI-2L]|uniref:phytoene desaturase family protein n=1 Tax=Paraburkholderia sp. A1RI-2L TaxID=3028367 RepID=UPI003B7FAAD9
MNDVFDVVCIGSGIAALSYSLARLIRDPGTRLLIVEKHRIPGGYATGFFRPRLQAHFEVSLHKLTGMGSCGNLRATLERLGVLAELDLVFPDTVFTLCHEGNSVIVPAHAESARAALLARFPHCEAGLQTVFDEIGSYGFDSYMQFQTLSGEYEPDIRRLRYAHANLKSLSVTAALHERIPDPLLRELLSLPSIYVGAFPEQISYLYFLHVWYAALFAQSAYLRGGATALTAAFVARIQELGGKVVTRAEAQKILIDHDTLTAQGVVTDAGTYASNEIIANVAPRYALEHLIDHTLPGVEAPAAAIAAQQPASATTTLYLVLDSPPSNYGISGCEMMLLAPDPDAARGSREAARAAQADETLSERAYWHDSAIEVTNYHQLDPARGCVVVVNALDLIHHWPMRKTPEYRAKKARAKSVLLGRLLAAFPALEGHVRYAEVATPRTSLRYTHNTDGSGYGAIAAPSDGKRAPSRRLPFRNLQFVSHWTSGGGYEASIGYGALLGFQVSERIS